jgi:DNA-binding NtrC family response regulator
MLKALPILIISGEKDHREKLADRVFNCGLRPVCCDTIADAKTLVARQPFGAVLSEDSLADGDYRAVIRELHHYAKNVPVVIVSRRDDWDSYLEAVGVGAFDYVAFPPNPGELERVIWTALSESKRSERVLAPSPSRLGWPNGNRFSESGRSTGGS